MYLINKEMKNLKKINWKIACRLALLCLIALSTAMFTSCGDDDDDGNSNGGGTSGSGSNAALTVNNNGYSFNYVYWAQKQQSDGNYLVFVDFYNYDILSMLGGRTSSSLPSSINGISFSFTSSTELSDLDNISVPASSWDMSGELNGNSGNDYEGEYNFDASNKSENGTFTITKSGSAYTVTIDPFVLTCNRYQNTELDETRDVITSFRYTGSIIKVPDEYVDDFVGM